LKRILILALGSRGDVLPPVTLGGALAAAGHRVRVATFALFEPMVRGAGLDFALIRGDAEALLRAASQAGMMQPGSRPLRAAAAISRSYGALSRNMPDDLSDPALRDTDLVLNQLPGDLFGWDLAELLCIPHAQIAVIPLARTRTRPLTGFPLWPGFFPGYNLLTYRLGEQMAWQMFRASVNRWRAGAGLKPQSFLGMYGRMQREHTPVINGFSEHVVPRPADWGAHIHVTGWWPPARQPEGERLPGELLRFLQAGGPPVFIGFGSMPVSDPARVTALVVEAARMAGQRVVLHAGWAGLGGSLPGDIYPLTWAPYDALFPRMAAVVHHGGSGTTGCALRSGVPSLVIPFGFDQGAWGRWGAALGVGPQPLPFQSLMVERLAGRIRDLVENPAYRQSAAALGETLRAEQGLQRAVEIIERLSAGQENNHHEAAKFFVS